MGPLPVLSARQSILKFWRSCRLRGVASWKRARVWVLLQGHVKTSSCACDRAGLEGTVPFGTRCRQNWCQGRHYFCIRVFLYESGMQLSHTTSAPLAMLTCNFKLATSELQVF